MPAQTFEEYKYHFIAPPNDQVVVTGLIKEVIERTRAVHPGHVIWYGESRLGKTTTAAFLTKKINEAYDPHNPHAYRAVHYTVGRVDTLSGNEQKKGIKSLFYATIGKLDEGFYRHTPPEGIAAQLVQGLMRRNVQRVFIDEAGKLSVEAIDGIMLVGDTAKIMGHPISFIFIGMDDLPTKVRHLPQVENRIVEWCYFEAYSYDETVKLLAKLHPHFGKLDPELTEDAAQFECIYELFGGYPGHIVPFLRKLDRYQGQQEEEITLTYLRTVHVRTLMDKEQAINKSLEIYTGRPPRDRRLNVTRSSKSTRTRNADDKGSNNGKANKN